MPIRSEDMPGEKPEKVEQATAAPGETRNVKPPTLSGLCEETVVVGGTRHPCDRESGHKGGHSYRGTVWNIRSSTKCSMPATVRLITTERST